MLLPPPARRVPLMIGSTGERVLHAALPWADAWNTWFDATRNTPEGFAGLSARVSQIAEGAGRDPAEIDRSVCVLVILDRDAGERAAPDGIAPLEGGPERIADGLHAYAEAGADEAIVVASPITERSIRDLGETLELLRA